VVEKVGVPDYSKNRQSRASKGFPRFECYPVLNHAQPGILVIGQSEGRMVTLGQIKEVVNQSLAACAQT
jgi:hypothetical protein